jgi:hypothetical protein
LLKDEKASFQIGSDAAGKFYRQFAGDFGNALTGY